MNLEIVLIIIVSILIAVIFYLITKKDAKFDSTSLKMIQDQIISLNKNIDYKLWESNRNTQKNFDINSKISHDANRQIEEITKKLSNLDTTNKQIKDIWGQLEGLESILKNTKQRGILWEYFLESVLKNILPPNNYKLQYTFKNWDIVDWVIFVKDKIIPIDSKFSLENYNKIIAEENISLKEALVKDFRNDLKKRIDEKLGDVVNKDGEVIGDHDGVWFYTIGQRHGFRTSKYHGMPLYVTGKDVGTNQLIVGYAKDGERENFEVDDVHWIGKDLGDSLDCTVRIRHLGELYEARYEEGLVKLKYPTFGVAPGQSAVFYVGEHTVGGGVIK